MAVGSRWISSPPSERRTAAGGRGRFTWCPGCHLQIPWFYGSDMKHSHWDECGKPNQQAPKSPWIDGWVFNHPQMNRFIIGLPTLWRFILMKSIIYIEETKLRHWMSNFLCMTWSTAAASFWSEGPLSLTHLRWATWLAGEGRKQRGALCTFPCRFIIYIYNTCYLPTECLYWFGGATSVCLGERVLQLSESQAICGFL